MNTIGVLTPCWNEEATIVFTIASLIDVVDHYVVVDSGSTDCTVALIKHFFAEHIRNGKLILLEYGHTNFDMGKVRNAGIKIIRDAQCDFFLKIDADDVFYSDGAHAMMEVARGLSKNVTLYCINQWELYQYRHVTTKDWLGALVEDINGRIDSTNPHFMCSRIPPAANPHPSNFPKRYEGSYGHARIYNVRNAVAAGKWTDEAQGKVGEDIHHPGLPRVCIGNNGLEWIVHYGWARPLEKKLEKGRAWYGISKEREDVRVDRLHTTWKYMGVYNIDKLQYGDLCWPHNVIFPFNRHPEVVTQYAHRILDFLNAH